MKKIFLLFLLINFGADSYAQIILKTTPRQLTELQVAPKYPGPGTFQDYVLSYIKNVRFKVSQRVDISFIVEKDGTLSNVVFPEGTEEKMIKKVLRAFRKSKKWSPGTDNGKPVRVRYTLPIRVRVT